MKRFSLFHADSPWRINTISDSYIFLLFYVCVRLAENSIFSKSELKVLDFVIVSCKISVVITWAIGTGVSALPSHGRGHWFKSSTAHSDVVNINEDL